MDLVYTSYIIHTMPPNTEPKYTTHTQTTHYTM